MQRRIHTRAEPFLLPTFPRHICVALRGAGFEDAEIFDGLDNNRDEFLYFSDFVT